MVYIPPHALQYVYIYIYISEELIYLRYISEGWESEYIPEELVKIWFIYLQYICIYIYIYMNSSMVQKRREHPSALSVELAREVHVAQKGEKRCQDKDVDNDANGQKYCHEVAPAPLHAACGHVAPHLTQQTVQVLSWECLCM